MPARRVECPGCRTSLLVPEDLASRKVRCAFCKTLFDISKPRRVVVEEDIVASWLKNWSPENEEAAKEEHFDPNEQTYIAPAAEEPQCKLRRFDPAAAHARHESPVAVATRDIRVVRILPRAVELEFPAERLLDSDFRSALPRRCMRCAGQTQLGCFLVTFAPRVRNDIDLTSEHEAGHISLSAEELGSLRGEELLRRLPTVPNVPYPGNLPFPYYVCQQCTAVGLVAGQIQVNTETHKGLCRLMLGNVSFAAYFFSIVGDKQSDDFHRLTEALNKLQIDPWNSLPVAVRHRIEQWFRLFSGEAFLAFVPDSDLGGNELGMAGLLISTRRVVYHRPPRHRETTIEDRLSIRLLSHADKQKLQVESARLSTVTMSTDRAGVKLLREGLHMAGVPVTWH